MKLVALLAVLAVVVTVVRSRGRGEVWHLADEPLEGP
jgi:hypothetical protein